MHTNIIPTHMIFYWHLYNISSQKISNNLLLTLIKHLIKYSRSISMILILINGESKLSIHRLLITRIMGSPFLMDLSVLLVIKCHSKSVKLCLQEPMTSTVEVGLIILYKLWMSWIFNLPSMVSDSHSLISSISDSISTSKKHNSQDHIPFLTKPQSLTNTWHSKTAQEHSFFKLPSLHIKISIST